MNRLAVAYEVAGNDRDKIYEPSNVSHPQQGDQAKKKAGKKVMRVFLCGDVMVGRGIDQILPHPCSPQIHESYMHSAIDYLRLAEQLSGPIRVPVDFAYIWGDALDEFARRKPHVRIVNLETSITRSEDFEAKGINYRISPKNAECLRAAAIDCCVLANNHVLDWGRAGLRETLHKLRQIGIKTAGAGGNSEEASAAAILPVPGRGRVVVASVALATSGVPWHWRATRDMPGVNLLPDLSPASVASVCGRLAKIRAANDLLIVSIHWGGNWGYEIPDEHIRFAHELIDRADVSVIHGHSSHHAKGLEIYRNRLILYGCGDFLNDYEGIAGYDTFRNDLSLGFFADMDARSGDLAALEMVPLQIRRFRLEHASQEDAEWLARTLDRESARFGAGIRSDRNGTLIASWPASSDSRAN